MRREHEEKEPGPDGGPPGFPVSNAATAASDCRCGAPADRKPQFVQTPNHITQLIRRAAVVSGCPFFKGATSFSQQIPKVICERSCRMAKTLCVTIPQILKNKSAKRKKIEKKIHFSVFFAKTIEKNGNAFSGSGSDTESSHDFAPRNRSFFVCVIFPAGQPLGRRLVGSCRLDPVLFVPCFVLKTVFHKIKLFCCFADYGNRINICFLVLLT